MSVSVQNMVKTLIDAVKKTESKTSAYDTPATVRRIEGDTAWVHINGGVDETPVKLTIAANVGDDVQVRVSGGRAFLVGNGTAPPTDDKTAIHARTLASNAQSTAADAQETAKDAANTANTAYMLAEGTSEHFWHDNTGAHITQVTQEDYRDDPENAGGNTLITSDGMAVRDGLNEVAAFTSNGQVFNNEYGYEVMRVGKTPSSTYNFKRDWVTYNNESPFSFLLPWDCSIVITATYADASYNSYSGTELGVSYTADGREITYDTTSCSLLQANSIKYIQITYHAVGDLPYYSIGSRGIGDIGHYSCCEGVNTVANGNSSHAEGDGAKASGLGAHAEGQNTIASGDYSHTEGSATQATYRNAHAEGSLTVASHESAHAEGASAIASGAASHAQNIGTVAQSWGQTAMGEYNVIDTAGSSVNRGDYALIIGNGTDDNNRSNAMTVDWSGNIKAAGDITDGSSNTLSSVANTVNTYVSNIKVIRQTGTITISAGSASSPSSTNLSVSGSVGNGTLVGAELLLGQQALPYGVSGTMQTWLWHVENTNKRLVIKNATSAWTNYSYTAILFVIPE